MAISFDHAIVGAMGGGEQFVVTTTTGDSSLAATGAAYLFGR